MPTQLSIKTNSLDRYLKERQAYIKEIATQEEKIKCLQQTFDKDGNTADENAEFKLKQEKQAQNESQAVLPVINDKIRSQITDLQAKLAEKGSAEEEVEKAKTSIAAANKVLETVEG